MGDLCPSRSSSSQCSGSCFWAFWIRIRILNICMDPDPSINKQKMKKPKPLFLLFCHFFLLFILNDVNVQKGLSIKTEKILFIVGILKVTDEKNRIRSQIRIRFRSVSQCTDRGSGSSFGSVPECHGPRIWNTGSSHLKLMQIYTDPDPQHWFFSLFFRYWQRQPEGQQ